jgi:hypothetical protein
MDSLTSEIMQESRRTFRRVPTLKLKSVMANPLGTKSDSAPKRRSKDMVQDQFVLRRKSCEGTEFGICQKNQINTSANVQEIA